jgi:hypothetical protein
MCIGPDHFICKEHERSISILAISMKKMWGLFVGSDCIKCVDLLLLLSIVYTFRGILWDIHTEVWLCPNKSKKLRQGKGILFFFFWVVHPVALNCYNFFMHARNRKWTVFFLFYYNPLPQHVGAILRCNTTSVIFLWCSTIIDVVLHLRMAPYML